MDSFSNSNSTLVIVVIFLIFLSFLAMIWCNKGNKSCDRNDKCGCRNTIGWLLAVMLFVALVAAFGWAGIIVMLVLIALVYLCSAGWDNGHSQKSYTCRT